MTAPAVANPSASRSWLTERRWDVVTAAVIVLQVALSIHFAATASVTHDEFWHLPVGALHVRTARFDWEPLNPPLIRTWAGLPVALLDRTPVPDGPIPPGEYGDRFVAANPRLFPERSRRRQSGIGAAIRARRWMERE